MKLVVTIIVVENEFSEFMFISKKLDLFSSIGFWQIGIFMLEICTNMVSSRVCRFCLHTNGIVNNIVKN